MARAASGAVYVDIEPKDVRSFVTNIRAQLKTQRGIEIPVELDVRNVDKGLSGVQSGLTKTSSSMRRTADDTDRLSGKFKAFNLLTGLAAPKVIAFTSALGPAILGTTNLTAALVPTVGILGALPAAAGAGAVALGTLKLATAGFGDTIEALVEGDGKKFNETLEKLSPNARSAARQLSFMRPELAALQQQVQDRFFAGFAEDIRVTGQSYLPILRRELPAVSSSMSGFVDNFAAGVRQGEAMRGVNDVLQSTSGALSRANDNVRPLTASILSLGTSGAPSVLRLGNAFAVGSGMLAQFIQRNVEAGNVTVWIDQAIDTFKTLGGVVYNTGSILYSVFSAGNTAGGGFLGTLRDITGQAAEFLRSMEGAQALTAFFAGLSAISGGLGTVLGALLPALGEAFVILSPGISALVPAIAQLAVALAPLIPALADLALSLVPSLVDVINVLIPVVTFLADALAAVFTWVSQHPVISAFITTILLGVVAFKVFTMVVSAIVVITKAWAVAQMVLNAAWAANPIGLIILGIVALGAALVLAYRRSETFRNIVQATINAIVVAAQWMWNTVLKPIWDGMKWYFDTIVFPVWRFLYDGVIKPVFDFIIGYAQFWWTAVSAVFTGVVWFLQNFVFPWWVRLYEVAIKPTFDAISGVISWWWNNITLPIFDAVMWVIDNVLIPGFKFWWSVAKEVFDGIGSAISWVWKNVIKPVFDVLKDAVMNTIPDAFRVGKDAIGKAWDLIKDIAKAPIKFVIETVINNGIIDAYNWIASKFGVKKADHVPLPKGFHTGGVVPGYAPGVDTVPAVLSPGEGILRPEVVRALGAETILAWNKKAMNGEIPRFASGGIVPGRKPHTGGPLDFLKGAVDFITDPVGAFKKKLGLDSLLEKIANNDFAKMIGKIPRNIVDFIIDKVKGFFDIGGGASPNLRAPGGSSIGMLHSIAKMFYPGARVSSGYRPGDPGWHGKGLAADLVGGGGAGMRRIAAGFYQLAPNLLELIHTPGGYFVKNGQRRDVYNAATKADHYDHVHVAATAGSLNSIQQYDSGGWLKPGYTLTYNGTGKPEAILTNKQWKALEKTGGGKTTNIVVNYPPDVPTERAIQDAQYRHELLYGG
jgi:phage-related protein